MMNLKKVVRRRFLSMIVFIVSIMPAGMMAQTVQDDFEGTDGITTWYGDNCGMNTNYSNPYQEGINNSATVLRYEDTGGQYANVRFDIAGYFDLATRNTFAFKIYVPSASLTGGQANQVSLKLQNATLAQPWTTQTEIIKSVSLDQWQEVIFNFDNDTYINLDADSAPPDQRTDLDRVVIQVNGENNYDQVLAYIDDLDFYETVSSDPVFDELVWSDEFEGNGPIDSDKWFHQTQLPNGESWYNNEIQHYTDRVDNSSVSDGVLKLVAKKETFSDQGQTKQYTSARLNSKFAFTHGKVEIKAKLPSGIGTWPALWMLGKNINENGGYWDGQGYGTTSWPACGEIDIMEHWGDNQNYIQSAMHTPSSFGDTSDKGGQTIPTVSAQFHIYTVEWSAEKIVFSVDGTEHYTYSPEDKNANTWPFDAEQYLLFNVAIQPTIDPGFTESTMEVDYIRVYQESTLSDVETTIERPVKTYPNPVKQELHIKQQDLNNEIIGLQVAQVNGRVVEQRVVAAGRNDLTLDTSMLAQGLYFVKLRFSDNKTNTFKFIKE